MSFDDFLSTYVDKNKPPNAKEYDLRSVVGLLDDLEGNSSGMMSIMGHYLLVSIFCGMKRADLVPHLFRDVVENRSIGQTSLQEQFNKFRETLNVIWPFVGIPQVIPAALGLAGYLQSIGDTKLELDRKRKSLSQEDVHLGMETRKEIYKASANGEVFEMLQKYHGDLANALDGVAFGYNVGRGSDLQFSLRQLEILITAALIGLNANRQVGSHLKACIAFGYSEPDLEAMIGMAKNIALWLGQETSSIDVRQLAQQARNALDDSSF